MEGVMPLSARLSFLPLRHRHHKHKTKEKTTKQPEKPPEHNQNTQNNAVLHKRTFEQRETKQPKQRKI